MIPLFAIVHVRRPGGFNLRLWLPLILLWLLLAPLILLVLPLAILIALVLGMNPFPLIAGAWRVLSATRGVRVDVDSPDATVFVHLI
jgi:hypothetical protein